MDTFFKLPELDNEKVRGNLFAMWPFKTQFSLTSVKHRLILDIRIIKYTVFYSRLGIILSCS